MIDRTARERLARVLRSYMNEEITAFQFDEQLGEFRRSSPDKTVKSIARDLWVCYDDLKDHKVVASKQTWDYFNRALLLLSSKAEVEKVRSGVQWHFSQIFAGVCLVLALSLSFRIGWKINLLEVTCPFGLVSMVIGWFNQRRRKQRSDLTLYPFPTFGTLSIVRRTAVDFAKTAYPKGLTRSRIRHPIMNGMLWVPTVISWLVLSPIALFVQMLPKAAWGTRLELPTSEAAVRPADQLG